MRFWHSHDWLEKPAPRRSHVVRIWVERCDCDAERTVFDLDCGHRNIVGVLVGPFGWARKRPPVLGDVVECPLPHDLYLLAMDQKDPL